MQLRSTSEKALLRLISELQERSYRNFPPVYGWWSEGQFVSSQEPVALAIQEYLYHFPDSYDSDRLRWQLAFIESITFEDLKGNEYYDEWVVEQLENKLNHGLVFPDDVERFLDNYWFEVRYYQEIENLFGDQKPAWFYVIEPQVWEEEEHYEKSSDFFDRGGLFVVAREISQGKFEVYILENGWNFSSGSSSLFEISDFNKNGVPEIAINIGLHSGSMCGGNLKIFEWHEDTFEDLTRGNIQIGDCVDKYEYVVVDGKPSIRFKKFFTPVPAIYTWNGTHYEFFRYEHKNLVEKWWTAESPSEEVHAIEEILSSEDLEGLRPAYIDFLRFRLGIVYSLDSQESQAKQVFQDLVDNPSDKTRTIYSEFSKNFLKYYSGDESLYTACKKSQEIFYSTSRDLSAEDQEKLFGISSDNNFGLGVFGLGVLRCFESDVFELLVNKIPVEVENVPDVLLKNGMKFSYAEKQDINFDGISEEWLLTINDDLYVIYPNGPYYTATYLHYLFKSEEASTRSVTVDVAKWNGIQEPVLAISTDRELLLISVGDGYDPTWLNSEYDIENLLFSPQSAPAQYQVFYAKPKSDDNYYGVPLNAYRWDSSRHKFRDDLIEYTLFVEHNPDNAVEISEVVLPVLMDWKDLDAFTWWLPRYFYLSGLSYELSGNAQKAAEVYWQLWHDYPGSQYALLARYKLVPGNP